jgi:hypothetical protein
VSESPRHWATAFFIIFYAKDLISRCHNFDRLSEVPSREGKTAQVFVVSLVGLVRSGTTSGESRFLSAGKSFLNIEGST